MSNLLAPPVTVDLWNALRDRIATATMATILGGAARVYVEGDQAAMGEGSESVAWGRAVIVPTLPLGGTKFRPGFITPLSFLVRTEFNDYKAPGYNVTLSLELAQKEAFRQLQHWRWTPGASTKVMLAMAVTMDTLWEPRALYDEGRLGVVFVSSKYRLAVAESP